MLFGAPFRLVYPVPAEGGSLQQLSVSVTVCFASVCANSGHPVANDEPRPEPQTTARYGTGTGSPAAGPLELEPEPEPEPDTGALAPAPGTLGRCTATGAVSAAGALVSDRPCPRRRNSNAVNTAPKMKNPAALRYTTE